MLHRPRCDKSFLLRWGLGLCLVACVGVGSRGVAQDAAGPSVALTSFDAIGAVPAHKRGQPHPVRLEYQIFFHDPGWKVSWGRCAGSDGYLTLGPLPFSVVPGQRILIEGQIVPAAGMEVVEAKYTLIDEAARLPEALPTRGLIGETARFDRHLVSMEGYVEQQTRIDSNHLKVELISEGRAVTLRVRHDGKSAPPQLQGMQVSVLGVYSATADPAGDLPKLEVWVASPENIKVLGLPAPAESARTSSPRPIASYEELLQVSENKQQQVHRVRLEFLAYYHDPRWKVAWGRCAGSDIFLGLGELPIQIKPGNHLLIEGNVVPAAGLVIDGIKVTLLKEQVPLTILNTAGRIGETERFDKHMVELDGYVDQQSTIDGNHLKVDLVVAGRAVTVRLLLDGQSRPPELEGTFVRVQGVYSATNDPTGGLPKIELWVHGQEYVRVTGTIAKDERFEIEATPIERLGSLAAGKKVRVEGVVRTQQAGKSVTIRDDTGQLELLTAQTRQLRQGDQIEVIGLTMEPGAAPHLRDSLFRPAAQGKSGASAGGQPSILRLAEQVRTLSPEQAERHHSVQISGIVTWANLAAGYFFLNDISGGICVLQPPNWNGGRLLIGNRVDVAGTTAAGNFTPVVQANSVVATARIDPPDPRQVTLEQALTGIEDAQWISMSGYVRAVNQKYPWGQLELTTSAGEFTASLAWHDDLPKLSGSVVRVSGACSVITNTKRQLIGIQLWVPSMQFISVEEAQPADPFSVASRSIASLRQYSALPATNRRVRVAGVVVHQVPGVVLHLQEGTESLLVLSRDQTPVAPGERIEAVGFQGKEHNRVVLREAIFRKLGSGHEPKPEVIGAVHPIDVELDGRLVRIKADLLDAGIRGGSHRLVLQERDVIFEALLDLQKNTPPHEWVPGSVVELTGVYQVEYDEYKHPRGVRLLLRSTSDVVMLRRPPWLTIGRALAAISVLGLGLVLGFAWVVALRRRVQAQTGQIREQIESEKAARLEAALTRASKLESIGVLAGGIAHDFNNLLTVVLGNLSLAKMDPCIQNDTKECLGEGELAVKRARDLTQQLITFSKGGEPVRVVTVMPEVVREETKFALHGSKATGEFDFAPNVWLADVDQAQIGQVIHNVVINASHAMPDGGVIRIKLRNQEVPEGFRPELRAGRYLCLSISDTGTGIAPELLPRIFDPFFTTKSMGSGLGLATVYSIVKKHKGLIEVASKIGVGTTFVIWLPAVAEAKEPDPPPGTGSQHPLPGQLARVLLMDDEPAIRRLVGNMIKRLNLECSSVADGAAAVQEYQSAREAGHPYDLVILDLTVPGAMGGAEAMEQLLRIDPEVRAIVSSGYSNNPVMANFRSYGFMGVVSKPYEISALARVVEPILAERAHRE